MNRFAHRRPAAWTRAFGLLGIVLAATQCSKTSEPRLTLLGRWHAAIGTDAETTTVFIDVDTLISGRWIAEADIPSEELSDVPLSVELHGDTVRLQLVAGDESAPTLVARVPTAGTMQGVYTAEGATLPARLVRVGPPEISDEAASLSTDSDSARELIVLSADARELKDRFNGDSASARLVILLSPT